MKTRDVITGFIILVIVITGVLVLRNAKNKKASKVPSPTPSIGEQITNKFGGIALPSNADKVDLTNVSGGLGIGEAARVYENGRFDLTVLADLPEPKAGYFYQAWIVKDNVYLSLGRLRIAKGGYLTDFVSGRDYSDYKKVVVTEERVFDSTPETYILEGSF